MFRVDYWIGLALAANVTVTAQAAGSFSLNVTPGTYYGRYDGSEYRDRIQGEDLSIEGNASHWGFAVGYEHSRIKYKHDLPDFTQNAGYVSGRVSYTPEQALGSYTFRLDLHSVSDSDNVTTGDDVQVIASQVSYARLSNSVYLDLGYAHSRYENSAFLPDSLQVQQWTPTLGFALTAGATNWLKLRGYFIHSSNPLRSQNKKDTSAVELKYFYYPLSSYKLIPQYLQAGVLMGERIYAVDRDTASVANLAELEKGGISAAAKWRLSHSVDLLISATRSKFRELAAKGFNEYTQNIVWLGLSTRW